MDKDLKTVQKWWLYSGLGLLQGHRWRLDLPIPALFYMALYAFLIYLVTEGIVGAIVLVLIVMFIDWRRIPRVVAFAHEIEAERSRESSKKPLPDNATFVPVKAKYEGTCYMCGKPHDVGDPIWVSRGLPPLCNDCGEDWMEVGPEDF